MAKIDWIKLNIEMFSDQKIRIIKKMPEGKSIILIWVQLLTMAGKTNDKGGIYISQKLPYTDDMLAVVMDEEVTIVRMALNVLERFEMIDLHENGTIEVVNWGKYQNVESMDKMREDTRKRVAKYRAKAKALKAGKTGSNVTVTESNVTVTQQSRREKKRREVISKDITEREEEREVGNVFLNEIFKDELFLNETSKALGLDKEFKEIKTLATEFHIYKKSLEELTHKNYADYRKNFRMWLNKQDLRRGSNSKKGSQPSATTYTPPKKYYNG